MVIDNDYSDDDGDYCCCSSHQLIPATQFVVTKSAGALLIGRPENHKENEISGGETRSFPHYCTRDEGAQKINQFTNWKNTAAAGVQHRSFVCSHN